MKQKITGRLVIAVVSTVMEEAAMVLAVFWGLPKIGVNIPVWLLVIVMIGWAAYAIITYQMGSRALNKKPMHGPLAMLGRIGKVSLPLLPEGVVRVGSEIWQARAESGHIGRGESVVVVGQERLMLIVRKQENS